MIKTEDGTVFKSYDAYLKSKHWQAKKRELFRLLGKKSCTMCGTMNMVQVHHFTYERIGHEDMKDLTFLCQKCHELTHAIQKATSVPEAVALFTAYQVRLKKNIQSSVKRKRTKSRKVSPLVKDTIGLLDLNSKPLPKLDDSLEIMYKKKPIITLGKRARRTIENYLIKEGVTKRTVENLNDFDLKRFYDQKIRSKK